MIFLRKSSLILLVALIAISCSDDKQQVDTFSSPKALFVDYVASFTKGVVPRNSEIAVRFVKDIDGAMAGELVPSGIFKFDPQVEGTVEWQDARTLVFNPKEMLPSGTRYEVIVELGDLVEDISDDAKQLKFVVESIVQNYSVKTSGMKVYEKTDLTRVKMLGELLTADYAENENIKKLLTATQDGKNLSITWEHGEANKHGFVIENIVRSENKKEVVINLAGEQISVDRDERLELEIPSLNDYKVVSTQIVQGEENYISVMFSDPLDERQNLAGLVQLTDVRRQPRMVIDMNEIKLYPTSELVGNKDVVINASVKNAAGYQLKSEYRATLRFTQSKPEVRLIGDKKGAILPNSQGLILPFEAVGLKSVDVSVVKIFEDNVLQHLQVNRVSGNYQLQRVGRPIVRKTVPLNTSGVTNFQEWNQFTLDLADLITSEPGAIYQVKIGFRPQHSLYFCGDSEVQLEAEIEEDWGPEVESSYWDGYDDYYSSGYNWEERDNPCSTSYYGDRRSVKRMLFASDLGLIAKHRDNGDLHVFATSLINTDALSGVGVDVYDYQQQLIGEGTTDNQGMVQVELTGKPFVIVAKKEKQVGYLKVDDGSSLSLSNFDVSGQKVQNGIKGFLYGERGVWRPADTVHLSFMLETANQRIPTEHPVIMELWNPAGQLHSKKVSAKPVGNIYRFDMLTERDAPTGNWMAKAKVGGAIFYKQVKIEAVKPNRLKINLDFGKDRITALDGSLRGNLNIRWLHGAKGSNLKAEFEMLLSPTKTTFDGYANYNFDDKSKTFNPEPISIFQGKVDSEGNGIVNVPLNRVENAPGALTAVFKGKAFEEGGDFSIDRFSIPFYPYRSFVGIQAPEGDRRGMLLTDEDHSLSLVTLDANGNPLSKTNLRVELFKLNWRWWWDNSYDNISNYVGSSYRDPIKTEYVNTRDGKGSWDLQVNYPDWGRYFVRVTDPSSGHSTGQVVFLDWPGWAGKGKRGDMGGASRLDFDVEKETYSVGEKISLSIPGSAGNKALISIESGSQVLQTFWVETEDEMTNIEFEATPDMAPNIYAHITLLQPHGQVANDLPIRLYGVSSIKVVDPATELRPMLAMPDELRPEEEFEIEVNEKNGKAMAYTLAVVDEGLLDLTRFKTPDPWSSFYAREALGIKTWDVYDDVIGASAGDISRLLAVGGDDDLNAQEDKEANRFKPVVMYLGPFELEPGKSAIHKIKMPQYIGSVRTMVVAASKSGAYGNAEKATPVKQPMMILATLPRVAGPGEDIVLPVNVFAMNDDIREVSVSVKTSGKLQLEGSPTKKVQFTKAGDQVVYFRLKADPSLGYAKVEVSATSGSIEASYDVEMNVMARNPNITDVADKVLTGGESWEYNYEALGIGGTNEAAIELSALPPLNIEQRLKYLIRYPHGCIEQTTSSVFAQLYVGSLTELTDKEQQRVEFNIKAAIKRLKSFQINSGGFAYWPGGIDANYWGSNYAGHFMIEAKKAGYNVSQSMISSWVDFQSSRAQNWSQQRSDRNGELTQAYRLYTLALAGEPALGAMNRMKGQANLGILSKWRLAIAYVLAGYESEANLLIENISYDVRNEGTNRYTYGSPLRNQAMVLETLVRLNRREDAFTILKQISDQMSNANSWMSTQTTAYCFIGISQYAKDFPVDEGLNVALSIDGSSTTVLDNNFVTQIYLDAPDKGAAVSLTNNGASPIYMQFIRSGVPIEGGEISGEKNIRMTVKYKTMQGDPINVTSLDQGTDFMAEVTVTNPGIKGNYDELAITQLFPSGWEIINTRLDGTDEFYKQSKAEYIDIRDDRVMHYFDLGANKSATYKVLLNATYQGKYYLPAVSVEAMYDNTIYSHKPGKWVEVVPED